MLKKELRLNYIQKRRKISLESLQDFSLKIANNLLELPIWSFSNYHLFLPILEKNEIDTSFILSILQGKDKNVILPKMTGQNMLQNILLTDNTILRKNDWGVPEPEDGIEIPSKKIEVIFVPLLAYDSSGNRVGYGKGYYDKLLNECNPSVLKIGLSFFGPEDTISDINEHDVPLDYCVTHSKVYKF
ncbi:5-formyltetrahydrofolate cyclo-ligase [Saonia flava]|uniref:5-formyltetrahydrofolate cyclo-ligase n=1 Tax=Saonia flava TaxID=523696 RepID=A0A846QT67_9FLAO|nr:5-formyltetrahydrofolate cyclo-ligase [Saonia flava]NJB71248.1 5-formyltetrahydrofolate cyclo-ligase [Saonia flava]